MRLRFVIAAASLAVAAGVLVSSCSGPKAEGVEGGPCYGNGTCNDNLACLSHLCVNAPVYVAAAAGVGVAAPPPDAPPPDAGAPDAMALDVSEDAGPPASMVYVGSCNLAAPSLGCSDCLNMSFAARRAPCACPSRRRSAPCARAACFRARSAWKDPVYTAWLMCAANNCSISCGGGGT